MPSPIFNPRPQPNTETVISINSGVDNIRAYAKDLLTDNTTVETNKSDAEVTVGTWFEDYDTEYTDAISGDTSSLIAKINADAAAWLDYDVNTDDEGGTSTVRAVIVQIIEKE